MSPEQLYLARWLPVMTMVSFAALVGYIMVRLEGRRPSRILTVLVITVLVAMVCAWWRVYGR